MGSTIGERRAIIAARLGTTQSTDLPKEGVVSELSPDYFNRPLSEVDPEIAEVLRASWSASDIRSSA